MSYCPSSGWDRYQVTQEKQAMYDWVESILDYIGSKVYPYFISDTLKDFRSEYSTIPYLDWNSVKYTETSENNSAIFFKYLINNYYIDVTVEIPIIDCQPSVLIGIIRILNKVLTTDFSIGKIGDCWSICFYNPVTSSYEVIPGNEQLQIYNDFESLTEAGKILAIALN